MPGKYEVTVDAWENQRFKPLQGGWTKTYDLTPQFSDITGKKTVDYAKIREDLIPVAALPEGWEWVTDWVVQREAGQFGGAEPEPLSFPANLP